MILPNISANVYSIASNNSLKPPKQVKPNDEAVSKKVGLCSFSPQTTWRKVQAYYYHLRASRAHQNGQIDQAEPLYLKSFKLYQAAYGDEHPYVAAILFNLGDLYQTLKKYPEAENSYLRAYCIEQKGLGETHPKMVQTMQNLASLYHDAQKPKQAREFYQAVLSAQEKLQPPDFLALATTISDLGALLHEQHEFAEAEQCYQKAIAYFQQDNNATEVERISANLQKLKQDMFKQDRTD